MSYEVKSPKKLIEVALPLEAINAAAAREKSIRHGHPSTLHIWWARRPLAAARAVIFGQMVNDPSWKWEIEHPDEVPPASLKASWAASRKRLFVILEDLVKWENTNNEEMLEKARAEIHKSWRETCELNKDHPKAPDLFNPEKIPALHDPFAGGGTIPLEAQRLGLKAYASDLNPLAVLINKAMIEIPPRFAGQQPVNPETRAKKTLVDQIWQGVDGLAEDVRYYGQWMREQAYKRIGHLYPKIEVTTQMAAEQQELKPMVGKELTVIAWIWARTVKSPNPAFAEVDVPLASTFMLSTNRSGKEVFVEPVINGANYRFTVKTGKPKDIAAAKNGTKLARANFICLVSGTPISGDYIKKEGQAGRMGARMLAIVAEGDRGRVYLPPTEEMEAVADSAKPEWRPSGDVPARLTGGTCVPYGLTEWGDLFTRRQLVALTTFSDLVQEAREQVKRDALSGGVAGISSEIDACTYGDAIALYLGFGVDKLSDRHSTLCRWDPTPTASGIINTFSRHALPMTWDYAEGNPFSVASGNFEGGIGWIAKVIDAALPANIAGFATAADASVQNLSIGKVVSTDPPYYDNIGYADLSEFFYVWLRRSIKPIFPDLFATMNVPKNEELVATPYRHGSGEKAEAFFLHGMTNAMHRLAEQAHPSFPVTIYYAFKQAETNDAKGTSNTGWETFLDAVIRAGFAITGTWPMRTELGNRMIGSGTNALASSIILVCRQRDANALTISRRAFLREVNKILPAALEEMTRGAGHDRSPVAPVDLSQAIIGPGMAIFSKYAAVLEADGSAMSVKTALQLINRFLAEDDFDHDTQFCLHWFEQHGWQDGKFGEADTLARAKGTSVEGVKQAGVLYASGGIVRLLKWAEYPRDWDPVVDFRLPVWEALHHLIRVLKSEGESGAGLLLAAVQAKAEATRQLAYRLYTLCERAGWAEDARAYNEIITSWSAIEAAAIRVPGPKQTALFDA